MQRLLLNCFLLLATTQLCAQKVSGKLLIEPGKSFVINMKITNSIAQQAGSQAINFSANGAVTHHYKVINASGTDITLRHELDDLSFQLQGMGQQRSFDAEKKEDNEGPFGKQFKEIRSKKYDLTIDATGKTIKAIPETIALTSFEDRMIILTDMLSDLTGVIYPPKKGTPSFFYVLPASETGIGDSWTDSTATENERSITTTTLSAITDSTIVVDFKTTSVTMVKSETMGRQTSTRLNSTTTGQIILDRKTHIIREKTSVTESNGTTAAMGGMVPVSGKTTVIIKVTPQ